MIRVKPKIWHLQVVVDYHKPFSVSSPQLGTIDVKHLISLAALCCLILTSAAIAQPPTLLYAFDEGGTGPTANPGTGGSPTMTLNGLDMSGTSLNLSTCLSNGTNAATTGADTGYASDWTNGFTIAFCFDGSIAGPMNFAYLLGDNGLTGFRCFSAGAAGVGNIVFAGNGLANHILTGAAMGGWHHCVWQYDPAAGGSVVWLDGVMQSTQLGTPMGLVSTNTFKVGGNGTSSSGMSSGQFLEDFLVYDRVLSAAEIAGLVTACLPSIYSINDASASLTLDGTLGSPTSLASITLSTGQTMIVDVASTQVGLPWELAVTPVIQTVPLGGGGIDFGGGQILNLNLGAPGIFFINGGTLSVPFPGGFTAPVTLPNGFYAVQTAHIDPAQLGGVALSQPTDFEVQACSASSDFESIPLGAGNAPPQWLNPGSLGSAWNINSGATTSTGTGPTSAFSGTNYIYCETSVAHPATFSFETCAFDTTTLSTFTLNFALSRIGATMGTLTIEYDDGATGTWTPVAGGVYSGPDPAQAQGGVEWSQESLSFTPSQIVGKFRFSFVTTTSFTSDCAVDAISVQ